MMMMNDTIVTVKQLIEHLSRFHPDLPVKTFSTHLMQYIDIDFPRTYSVSSRDAIAIALDPVLSKYDRDIVVVI